MKQLLTLFFLCISISLAAQQHTDSIQEAMANYDYETVVRLISEEKPTPQLTLRKAQALRGLNRYGEAMDAFRTVVVEEPENLRALIELADCCRQAGRFSESLKSYEQALALNPGNKYVQLQRISMLCFMEQYAQVIDTGRKFMVNDSSTAVLRLMAQAQEGLMRNDSALHYYTIIVDKEPHDYLSVSKLANLYINFNEPQEAINITERYREKDSTNIHVDRQNAQAYCLTKDYQKAIDRYESLVNRGDNTRMTCYYLGMSYYAIDDFYGAHDFLRIAYKYDPKNINVLYYLGRACSKTSWKKEGVALLNEAINIATPSDSVMTNLYNGLVESCYLAGMYKEQVEAYKEIYKYNPQKHTTLYNIASVYQDYMKDDKNAEKYLEAFLKTKPKTNADSPYREGNTLILGKTNYYNAAERRLADIRKENFFRQGKKE